jgi:2-methylcitrate dehydratase
VFFKDGSSTGKISIDYPIGHRRRRAEGIPVLVEKFRNALAGYLPKAQAAEIIGVCEQSERMLAMPVPEFMDLFAFGPRA